jgi:hypothetical protein
MKKKLVFNLSGAIIVGLLSMWIFDFGITSGIASAIVGWFIGGILYGKL